MFWATRSTSGFLPPHRVVEGVTSDVLGHPIHRTSDGTPVDDRAPAKRG